MLVCALLLHIFLLSTLTDRVDAQTFLTCALHSCVSLLQIFLLSASQIAWMAVYAFDVSDAAIAFVLVAARVFMNWVFSILLYQWLLLVTWKTDVGGVGAYERAVWAATVAFAGDVEDGRGRSWYVREGEALVGLSQWLLLVTWKTDAGGVGTYGRGGARRVVWAVRVALAGDVEDERGRSRCVREGGARRAVTVALVGDVENGRRRNRYIRDLGGTGEIFVL